MKTLSKTLRTRFFRSTAMLILASFGCAMVASAEPVSPNQTTVTLVRPYAGSNLVYVHVNSTELCGVSVFSIAMDQANGKEMYAAALTAVAANKKVLLEVSNATGCTGFATRLQSIYLHS